MENDNISIKDLHDYLDSSVGKEITEHLNNCKTCFRFNECVFHIVLAHMNEINDLK